MMNAPVQSSHRGGYVPVAAHSRPPVTPARRPAPPGTIMSVPPQAIPPTATPQMLAAAHRNALAQQQPGAASGAMIDPSARRSRKPTEKNLPDGVDDIVIGDGAAQYRALRDVERRLDATMMRKRLDMQDAVARQGRRFRTLRLWISNTGENQEWQRIEESAQEDGPASYRVRIEGRLLNDGVDPMEAGEEDEGEGNADRADPNAMEQDDGKGEKGVQKQKTQSTIPPRKRLSHFFKSITVDFGKPNANNSADTTPITWVKPVPVAPGASIPEAADFDSIEFSRQSSVNLNATINLVRDETPERLRLSPELAAILDTEEETRPGIVVGLWEYVRAMGLQESEDRRAIRCDERLFALFHTEKTYFPHIPNSVTEHTSPLPPIRLPYTIRLDPDYLKNPTPTIYDIRVAVDDPLRSKMMALTTSPAYAEMLRDVAALDDQLALVVQAVNHSRAKHSFFASFSEDPALFVRRWVGSQRRDLENILGDSAHSGGGTNGAGAEFRRGGENGAWDTPAAREAVRYMLAKPARR